VDPGAQAPPPLPRAGANGARARDEPNKARLDRQPPTRACKAPLPEFIEHLYFKRFGREQPEVVVSVEERARQVQQQKADRNAAKAERRSDTSITGDNAVISLT
jgi:hypothetical protein